MHLHMYKFKLDLMILMIALLNDGTIMTLSVDRVLPSNMPDGCQGLAKDIQLSYGVYHPLSTTIFFLEKFSVSPQSSGVDHNDYQMYLPVAAISQAAAELFCLGLQHPAARPSRSDNARREHISASVAQEAATPQGKLITLTPVARIVP
ncbi:hypothetical protein B0H15DRAFT_584523 [Mycena belliarum]|uniref:Uncharacterized protein n=1 Tax=Mycena belliarum TaxID=1033014 RepID=A0AAD6UEQ4_9AGAR|nr:hypothetical protein B0H15DRAFT_584523 [Mycena belliae]